MPNPTTQQIEDYLVVHNGWLLSEVHQLLGYYHRNVNADGTTTLSRDKWVELAEEF